MIVVSDTSAIFWLARVNQVDLLHRLFGTVIVPTAVATELDVLARSRGLADLLPPPNWIEIREPATAPFAELMEYELDPGESAAILLARELMADFLIVDDGKARVAAKELGLRFVGLGGVLVLAKQRNLLPEIRSQLESLVQLGFWLGPSAQAEILRLSGEAE